MSRSSPGGRRHRRPRLASAALRASVLAFAFLACGGDLRAAPQETVLLEFSNEANGARPFGGLVADASGALYGTTSEGGPNFAGTIFKLAPPPASKGSWTLTVLYSFGNGADGGEPHPGLVLDKDGALYGLTSRGGKGDCTAGCGVAFKLAPPAKGEKTWSYSPIYSFRGGADGYQPETPLVLGPDGSLSGTTSQGGGGCNPYGCGTVFKLAPAKKGRIARAKELLHRFSAKGDGQFPSGLLLAHGLYFGLTESGGASGDGTVFELAPRPSGAWRETILHSFAGAPNDGGFPRGDLAMDKSRALFGTAASAGLHGGGVVFKLVPKGANSPFALLHNFDPASGDGESPFGVALDKSGVLFGVTENGGIGNCVPFAPGLGCGVAFSLTRAGSVWHEKVLHKFTALRDGGFPVGGLLIDKSGALFGTTAGGGHDGACPVPPGAVAPFGCGVVFRLTK